MIALVPFEDSWLVVVLGAVAAVGFGVAWLRTQARGCLWGAVAAAVVAGAAFAADRLVVTDREFLQGWLPELAAAVERRDLETIIAALDPDLQPLREEARRLLEQAAPIGVEITALDIDLSGSAERPLATAEMIVRVTGAFLGPGSQGTTIVQAVTTLEKRQDRWLVTDCQVAPARTLGGRDGGARR